MAQNYEIYSDMSIDSDEAFAAKYGLKYLPMEYLLGDETFQCKEPESEETMAHFYDQLRNKVTTQTTQINQYNYIQEFGPLLKEGKDVLYISLSSGLSNTYESACLAAEMLKEDYPDRTVEVVDSLSATGGQGLLAESALLNREEGMGISENAAWLRARTSNVAACFKVVDLFYLMRGGRVSATTAALGTALNLRPVLIINEEGKLETIEKKRGDKLAMKTIVKKYAELRDLSIDPRLGKKVYILHGGCPEEAEEYKKAIEEFDPEVDAHIHSLSPIIGAHTGPGLAAFIFYAKSKR